MKKTVVINLVALSQSVLNHQPPFISKWLKSKSLKKIKPVLPAVTCSAQSTYLTGKYPNEHGIVANGWMFKDEMEIKLWRQSNKLVQSEKIWDWAKEKDPSFTCANIFWWYNMYSSVDYSITPRPQYPSDGRKLPDIYTQPMGLRDEMNEGLGEFPLFKFWGPATDISSSKWIAKSAIETDKKYDPTLTFIYLPHLDYVLQKEGHKSKKAKNDIHDIDKVVKQLIEYYEEKNTNVILLSEYGINPVTDHIDINRILRKGNFIQVRVEEDKEVHDVGGSDAFALADHQIAHVYLNNPSRKAELEGILKNIDGVDLILDEATKGKYKIDHDRSGDYVLVAKPSHWFTYYYWIDDRKKPDFADTVDIHKKPGYDPCEMFMKEEIKVPMLNVGGKLIKKKLGFRTLMNVISTNPKLIKGSHGAINVVEDFYPVIAANNLPEQDYLEGHEVFDVMKSSLIG